MNSLSTTKLKTYAALFGLSMSISPLALLAAGTAQAANTAAEISIPVSTIVRRIGVGNTEVLATKSINADYQGMVCDVKATAVNQGSVHPNNDLIVASNGTSVTLADVERAANVETFSNGTLTLGNNVKVSLRMGDDDVFSAGMDVVLSCEEPSYDYSCDALNVSILDEDERKVKAEAVISKSDNVKVVGTEIDFGDGTTETVNPATHTYSKAGKYAIEATVKFELQNASKDIKQVTCGNTVEFEAEMIEVCRDGKVIPIEKDDRRDTDTDAPCPVEQIEVCRDGEVIPIDEDDRLDTDTDVPCPVEKIEVCRDGKVIPIEKDDILDTDVEGDCPEVLGKTLPDTGAGAITTGLMGVTTLLSGAYGFIKSRR